MLPFLKSFLLTWHIFIISEEQDSGAAFVYGIHFKGF